MIRRLETLYPDSFTQVHRCILSYAGKTHLLNGYLSVNRPGIYRLVAQGEMGGTLFDIEQSRDSAPRLLKNPFNLSAGFIAGEVAGILSRIYLQTPPETALAARTGAGNPALLVQSSPWKQELYIFDGKSERLLSYTEFRREKKTWHIDYGYNEGGDMPVRMEIARKAPRYQLTIKVISNRKQ